MELLDEYTKKLLPPLYATEEQGEDAIAVVKFFTPDSFWSWYAVEFDGDDLFFGFVDGTYPEYGFFSLSELSGLRGPLGLKVERDIYFDPTPVGKLANSIMQHVFPSERG